MTGPLEPHFQDPTPPLPPRYSPKQRHPERDEISRSKFEYRASQKLKPIFEEKRSRKRVAKVLSTMPEFQQVSAKTAQRTIDKLSHKERPSLIHFKEQYLFPKAPAWSPLSRVKVPKIAFGPPKGFRRWDTIHWRTQTGIGEVRIQDRIRFPNAPEWSPFAKIKNPVLRFVPAEASLARKAFHKTQDQLQQHINR